MTTINHIGVSGGKDSTALLLWAVHESGYPHESLRVSWCDTGNEAPETVDYVRYLSETVWPIHVITPPMDFYDLAMKKKRFPSARVRFCTEELKVKPSKAYIQSFFAEGYDVLAHSGVRASESAKRATYPEREWDTLMDCEVYRPLLHWTLEDVWACHARYGVKRNPLYEMGCERVGCLPCVMSRKSEVLQIARTWPERIDRIRQAEQDITARHPRGDRGAWMASFFSFDKVPTRYRSVPVECLDGRRMYVPTIDDVVRWAEDGFAGQMDLYDDDAPVACSNRYGLCE